MRQRNPKAGGGTGKGPGLFPFWGGVKNEKGYTVVEMVLALAILGIVIFTTVKIFQTITRAYAQVNEKSSLERATVFTMEQMVHDIRQARSVVTLGNVAGTAAVTTNVHLDSAGVTVFSVDIPNVTDPVNAACDATLTYFLRTMPDGTVKLFQRMQYYTGAYTQAFPAMAVTDKYRLGAGITFAPILEPTPLPRGVSTPTPVTAGNTPTPVYNLQLGQMPGVYNSSSLSYDDVCVYYDSVNNMIALGLTLSLKSTSLTNGNSTASRRRIQLTSSISLRAQ